MQILIATPRETELSEFSQGLRREFDQLELLFTNNWTNLLGAVKVMAPTFVVLDQGLPEGSPLELVRKLITVNAMVNSIVVTELDSESFHQASEGLGIFAPLPAQPTLEDGAALARRMRRFMGVVGATSGPAS